ncbi:MAG: helix-turn-helix transcriptional regulator [Acinetobacter sp.]
MVNISKLKYLLDSGKYTKVALAAHCGFSRVTVDNLLSGADVKISTIEGVANAFGVPVGYFFDEETPVNQNTANVKGDNNVLTSGHSHVTISKLSDCEKEVVHLNALIAQQETIIKDKERTIQILLKDR